MVKAPVVIKLGGRALDGPGALAECAKALAGFGAPAIVVHGGGAEVSAWCERLGVPPRFEDGLRVTDPATLDVAVAVLAGLANQRLVAILRAAGLDAIGLSAVDGGWAEVVPHPDAARLGAVGEVRAVNVDWLAGLLAAGRLPVLSSIGAHAGALLNLNADDLAAAVAGALRARALLLLSDAPGLIRDGVVVPALDASEIPAALEGPGVSGGMRPKLRAAAAALAAGVGCVHIAAWQGPRTLGALLEGQGIGTRIAAGALAGRADD